jgi:hypothetical protein
MAHFSVCFKAFDRNCLLRARNHLQQALALCKPSTTAQPTLIQGSETPQEGEESSSGSEQAPHPITELLGPHPKVCMQARHLKIPCDAISTP